MIWIQIYGLFMRILNSEYQDRVEVEDQDVDEEVENQDADEDESEDEADDNQEEVED